VEADQFEIKVAAAVRLYEQEKISQAKAAELAGLSRAEFIDALARYHVSPFQMKESELIEEITRD
jgi:predicted HTH domain antitoxin